MPARRSADAESRGGGFDRARALLGGDGEKGQGPDDLQPHLPPIAFSERPEEEPPVAPDPPGVHLSDLFEEVDGPHRNEGVPVLGERRDRSDQPSVPEHRRERDVRVGDRAAIAASEQASQRVSPPRSGRPRRRPGGMGRQPQFFWCARHQASRSLGEAFLGIRFRLCQGAFIRLILAEPAKRSHGRLHPYQVALTSRFAPAGSVCQCRPTPVVRTLR